MSSLAEKLTQIVGAAFAACDLPADLGHVRGSDRPVKAVLLDVPASLLEQRRRDGLDGRDELWNGMLHMVTPPSRLHQALAQALFRVPAPLAEAQGLAPHSETGRLAAADDYRVPDQLYAPAVAEAVERYVRSGPRMAAAAPDEDGWVDVRTGRCRLQTVDGPRLRIEWESGAVEI